MQPGADGTSRVRDTLRQDIIFGRLNPGTRITEAALAAKYGMSRVPVREALRALEAEGFVESRPYAGSTVSAIPVEEADDLFAVRAVVEAATARRAAERAARQLSAGAPDETWWDARRGMARILDAGDAAVAAGRLDLLPDLNVRFHLGVAALADSRSLTALLRQLAGKIEWLYAADVGSRGKDSWSEHRRIMAAVDAGSAARAAELMEAHIQASRAGYLSRFRPAPD
ncbi:MULTISPECIES: GntR family transcriptional regulator [unclassified Arthrobacter]|uniref:GntR family transcriptional regulator n=1 Tax=unclassified Arthrobacter TaxID=235627 RepID=UPI002103276A|nr:MULTISPECIES: GntR family transcriptional regulator [unclassified Arthrobacter]MCQ1987617.1 GntR family transcriptional regulator [Arthrobacter sp. zg-Y844]MCQ1996422.1 GntR family transcriptional regulator [Arthrobacter sp. zg-Y1171]UWX82539.1 GntR family transcriptional regulator [Arthrobacter sp. zg-Y1171]